MAAFYVLPDGPANLVWVGPINNTVTVSGSVEAFNGAALRRHVYVFQDKNPQIALDFQETIMPGGTFSFELDGHEDTQFTVMVVGEDGENSKVYAHCEEP